MHRQDHIQGQQGLRTLHHSVLQPSSGWARYLPSIATCLNKFGCSLRSGYHSPMNDPALHSVLTESLKKEAIENATRFEQESTAEIVRAMASASPKLDTFVSWCLGGTGATAALLAGNLDKVTPVLGSGLTKIVFASIVISILCGSASKFLSVKLQVGTEVMNRAFPNIQKLKEAFNAKSRDLLIEAATINLLLDTRANASRLTETYTSIFPRPYGFFIRRQLAAAARDGLHSYRMMAGQLVGQFWWCAAQLFFITVGLICIVVA